MLIWINMLSFPGNLLPTESCSRCRRWRRSRRSGVFRLERKANRFIGTMRLSKRCTFYLRVSVPVCVCVLGGGVCALLHIFVALAAGGGGNGVCCLCRLCCVIYLAYRTQAQRPEIVLHLSPVG